MGTGSAVIARGQQLVGCEETIVHYQGRPVWVRGREGGEWKMREEEEEEKGVRGEKGDEVRGEGGEEEKWASEGVSE